MGTRVDFSQHGSRKEPFGRLNAARGIVGRTVHQTADPIRLHLVAGVGNQQRRELPRDLGSPGQANEE